MKGDVGGATSRSAGDRPALSESLRTVRNVGRIVWMVVLILSPEAGSDGLASRGRNVPPGIRAPPRR
jgi:hypothetical protein